MSHLPCVAHKAGEAPALALLDLLHTTVQGIKTGEVGAHHEAIFAFLLRPLDVRQERPNNVSVERIETAAVECLVTLTLKLSELRFKPLFLRLLEWASVAPASQPGLPSPQCRPLIYLCFSEYGNLMCRRC